MMTRASSRAVGIAAALTLLTAGVAAGQQALQPTKAATERGVEIRIANPDSKRFVLALDEIVLEWTGGEEQGREAAANALALQGAVVAKFESGRVSLVLSRVRTSDDLRSAIGDHEAANPGAEGYAVLYESGRARSPQTRRLLTREVAILLKDGAELSAALSACGVGAAIPLDGVPGAVKVIAGSPLDAPALAESCQRTPGVLAAYPLLRRQASTR